MIINYNITQLNLTSVLIGPDNEVMRAIKDPVVASPSDHCMNNYRCSFISITIITLSVKQ